MSRNLQAQKNVYYLTRLEPSYYHRWLLVPLLDVRIQESPPCSYEEHDGEFEQNFYSFAAIRDSCANLLYHSLIIEHLGITLDYFGSTVLIAG